MSNLHALLKDALTIEGALGVALVDAATGLPLGAADEGSGLAVDVAAAGGTDVLRAMTRTLDGLRLGDDEGIEDLLVTTTTQLHLLRVVSGRPGLFFCLVLDRDRATLGMARFRLATIERELVL